MDKLIPWQFESGAIHYHSTLKNEIYTNRLIENYLEVGNHDHNFVLVGPKGIGKTLFVNLKSHLFRNKFKGLHFYPTSGQLCENLMLDNNLLSKKDLLRFANESLWPRIWRLVLSITACRASGIPFEVPVLKELVDSSRSISTLLTTILSNRSELDNYLSGLKYMTQHIEQINSGVCIFLDNIDQAFEHFLMDYDLSDFDDYRTPPSVDLWTFAQIGLLAAIYDLNRHNSHIKVYSTLRSEAVNCLNSPTAINFKKFCVTLKYSKEEVKSIFEKNIEMMDDRDYVKPGGGQWVEKFLGIKKISHISARTPSGIRIYEPIFDFLYRHSFGRPRELVYMGFSLYNNVICSPGFMDLNNKERIHRIRKEVNNLSEELSEYYFKEIIPAFDKQELFDFIKVIQSNVVPSEYILNNNEPLVKKYFSMGILGFIQRDINQNEEHIYTQKFLPVAEHSFKKDVSLPNTKYYLTHPSLDKLLAKVLGLKYYNPYNIIGRNKKFVDHQDFTRIYDVAFSYANTPEERNYVEEVADFLNRKNIKVFYDHFNIEKTWGWDLNQALSNIYNSFSRFCVIFVSRAYVERRWTVYELNEALNRHKQNKKRYLLPVRFDNTPLDAIKDMGYVETKDYTPSELADLICMTIKDNE